MKENIIISACLMGCNTRYDGINNLKEDISGWLPSLMEKYNLIPVCPEQLGGLATPRVPSERRDGGVYGKDGSDVTKQFVNGAKEVLRLAKLYGAKRAILKEKSPSCGSGIIYDGSFSGQLVEGYGVTAEMLEENGIKVYGEKHLDELTE